MRFPLRLRLALCQVVRSVEQRRKGTRHSKRPDTVAAVELDRQLLDVPRPRDAFSSSPVVTARLPTKRLLFAWFVLVAAVYSFSWNGFSTAATLAATTAAGVLLASRKGFRAPSNLTMTAAIAATGAVLLLAGPSMGGGSGEALIVFVTVLATLVAAALLALHTRWAERAAILVVVLTTTFCAALIIVASPPDIDVWNFTQQAAQIMLQTDIYGHSWDNVSPAHDPWVVVSGFPYLPMTAVLLAPFRWLTGDIRWAMFACFLIGAALIGGGFREGHRTRLALLFLLTPGTLLMIDKAWTEPLVFALLAPAILCFDRRHPVWGTVLLALALATKQHVLLLTPLFFAWHPAGPRRSMAALGGAAALCLPWIVAGPATFWHDTIYLHVHMMIRRDASTLYILALRSGWQPPLAVGAVVLLAVIVSLALRVRRFQPGAAGVSLAAAAVLLVATLVNKQGFINQYWLVAALMLFGLAEAGQVQSPSPGIHVFRLPWRAATVPAISPR